MVVIHGQVSVSFTVVNMCIEGIVSPGMSAGFERESPRKACKSSANYDIPVPLHGMVFGGYLSNIQKR